MAAKKPQTRNESGTRLTDLTGPPKEFSAADGPTNRAIIQMMLLLREEAVMDQGPNGEFPGEAAPKNCEEGACEQTAEPAGRYLAHLTPEEAIHPDKAENKVAEVLYQVLEKFGATETCYTLGGDSYNGNTGWKGCTNDYLERMLGHKCHLAVCICHTNNLPLRHLMWMERHQARMASQVQ